MPFLGDYHTHTIYSHGKGSIEDNITRAISIGLKEIAITDHGFRHGAYQVRRMDWPYMRADAQRMKQKYPEIKIYLGLETNIVHTNGEIDVKESDIDDLDILVCGYHKYVRTSGFRNFFGFTVKNILLDLTHKTSVKQTIKNTDAYIKAIEKNDIDILSHPNHGIKSDISEVAKAAAHYGTYLELNGKRISMTDEEIEAAIMAGAKFIADSDAHSASRIGDMSKPIEVIERMNIPKDIIVNWDKLPEFRSRKAKEKRNAKSQKNNF